MFDQTQREFLPELFFEITRAKNCRKYSFRKKMNNVDPICLEQNYLREYFKKILPEEIKTVEDPRYGVDYEYKGTTIDQKFSFGELGNNTIKIRAANRKLLNKSNWTMVINKDCKIELFETKKLHLFVKKNWGLVQKRLVEKKREYYSYAIRLDDLYKYEKVTPIVCEIEKENFQKTLEEILIQTNTQLLEETLARKETILNPSRRICFEPALALLAKQLFSKS
ncbi:MAG: hypothetical protein WCW13_00045 [archaeon]|jgi:hypothetical protein